MKRSKSYTRLLILLPFILGTIGLMIAGETLLNAMFGCVMMYFLNFEDTPPNLLVEIARWTAPLATAGSVLSLLNTVRSKIAEKWRYLRGKSVAVMGPEDLQKTMLEMLPGRGVRIDGSFVKARRYLLLGTEAENLAYYTAYSKEIGSRPVFMRCDSLSQQSVGKANLHPFSPEENAARLFWQERNAYALWKAAQQPMQIVLLGFGKLGEALVYHGMQMNLFAEDQQIEYHVFGDCDAFLSTHTSLDCISDKVIAHDDPWYKALPLIENAAMVLVCTQENQTVLVQKLLSATIRREIDVFTAGEGSLSLLEAQDRLRCFDWRSRSMDPELIFGDTLYRRAKAINLRYAHIYGGTEETPENAELEWQKLSAFTRGSNVSAADYQVIRLEMLRADGLPTKADALTNEQLDRLAALEHVRWCRYHWLNNWRHGTPANGKNKDEKQRIHALLIANNTLSEAEKEKDRENIRVLLSVE